MASPQEHIELDPEAVENDSDSVFDSQSQRSSTASITSSILEYRQFRGRSYQTTKDSEYWQAFSLMPNDDKHIEGFDILHHWLTMMLDDKLYLAPIRENPQRILDIGTGTGIWAIDMADTFPSAEIIATDISAVQPSWVPPNLQFQIDDAQLDWTFETNSFDFIHIRYMQGSISDWPRLYSQVFKALKPGGWFQHLEPDISMKSENPNVKVDKDHIFQQWAQLFYDVGEKFGKSFQVVGPSMQKWAQDAGFDDIVQKKFKVPYGTWPKDRALKNLGQYTGLYLDLSLDGFAVYPIGQVLGWSLEEVQVLVAKMRAAVHDPNNMGIGEVHLVYGQKPECPTPIKEPSPDTVAAATTTPN